MRVVGVGEADAGGFDQEAELFGVGERCLDLNGGAGTGKCCGFLLRDDGFVERAVGQADAALVAFAERTRCFQDNRYVKVSWQGDLLPNGKRCRCVGHSVTFPVLEA